MFFKDATRRKKFDCWLISMKGPKYCILNLEWAPTSDDTSAYTFGHEINIRFLENLNVKSNLK
jgi:hypothetical protein